MMDIYPKIRICISAYFNGSDAEYRVNACYAIVYCFLAQTYNNFEIYIHHDGPLDDTTIADKFRAISDKITFIDNLEHKGNWGFYHRYSVSLMEPKPDWVLYTNEDNYYVPTFLETMINTALSHNSKMVYCNMVHSHHGYQVLNTYPAVCNIDMGAFITHIDLIECTLFNNYSQTADGWYAEQLASKTNPIKVDGILFTHN